MSSLRDAIQSAIDGDENENELESSKQGDSSVNTDNTGIDTKESGSDVRNGEAGEVKNNESQSEGGGDLGAKAERERDKKITDGVRGEISAPEHWKAEDKETFLKLDKAGQEFVLRRHKEMEADYTKHKMEASEIEKKYKPLEQLAPVQQILAPFTQWAQSQGINESQLIAGWADAQRQLLTGNGKQLLLGIAQQYGIDLTGEDEDPRYSQLNQTVAQLKSQLEQTNQRFNQVNQSTIQQQLDEFALATDSSGKPLHPYFNDVMADMHALAIAANARKETPNIKSLYEQAVWLNPSVREQVLTSQKEAEAEKARQASELKKKQDQERARKANLASANVSGEGSTAAPTQTADTRSLIKEAIQRQEGRIL